MRRFLFILTLAARNLRRRPHRSLVMAASCGFAILIAVCYAALTDGLVASTEKNAVLMDSGVIQVHLPDYRENHDFYLLIPEPERVERAAARLGMAASFRLYGFALAAVGDNSAGVVVRGFIPEREAGVTRLYSRIAAGEWLGHGRKAVIGAKLAARLGVAPGDEIVLVAQAADGSMANDIFTVSGVLAPVSAAIDQGGVLVTEKSFREFFVLPSGVHEVALGGRALGREELARVTSELADALPGLEVMSWRQLFPVLARVLDTGRASLYIMLAIIYAAMAIVVLNAVLMGVFERVRELGMMRAVGMAPAAVFFMILAETAFLAISGGTAGLAVAAFLVVYGETHPLDLGSFVTSGSSIAGIAVDPLWYTRFDPWIMAVSLLLLVTVALAASLWPALRAALMKPVEALKYE